MRRAFGELPDQDEHEDELEAIDLDRYVPIEQIPSRNAFQFMEDFIDQLNNARAQQALTWALRGNKPFRRSRDALLELPEQRERWFEYEAQRRREYIEEWARDQGIEIELSDKV